jgi:hypothetical protein
MVYGGSFGYTNPGSYLYSDLNLILYNVVGKTGILDQLAKEIYSELGI